jgi:CubicO group peptidase (beta-lactamase class C family)
MLGPVNTHSAPINLYRSSEQTDPNVAHLNNFIDDLATHHPAAYAALSEIINRQEESQLKAALQEGPDRLPASIMTFLSLLTPPLRERFAILSHTEAYTLLAALVPTSQPRSDGEDVKNSIQNLATHHHSPVAPIHTTYQQLALWVGFMLRPLVFLLNLFKPTQAPTMSEEALQNASQATDTLSQQRMQERRIPSVVVTVIHKGQVIKTAAYGKAQYNIINPNDKSLELTADTQTVYRVNSLSKQFTATAILKLVEQGLVDLEASISTYIKNAPPEWKAITVRQLMTHRAGLPYQLAGEYPPISEQDQFPVPEDYLSRLLAQEPKPGRHIYSNVGYDLLGVIIKNVTQKPYSTFMQETFFTPLQMTRTGVSANIVNTDNFAIGYALQPGGTQILTATNSLPDNSLPDNFNEDVPLAGAGILSTIEDMAKWELALQGTQMLSKASKQILEQSLSEVWAQGKTDNGTTFLSAGGTGWGYNSSFIRYPASQSAVIVMANFDGTSAGSANISELAFEIAQLYPLA